jgi:hypothetical protein
MMDTRQKLIHAVSAYDRQQSTKRGYNHYALAQYFMRIDEITADIANGADVRKAISANRTVTRLLANRVTRLLQTIPT